MADEGVHFVPRGANETHGTFPATAMRAGMAAPPETRDGDEGRAAGSRLRPQSQPRAPSQRHRSRPLAKRIRSYEALADDDADGDDDYDGQSDGEDEAGVRDNIDDHDCRASASAAATSVARGNDLVPVAKLIVLNSFVGAYGLIQVSMFMLVLPRECSVLFPGRESLGLAGLLGLAGSTQLVCPIAGLFSDRMASPFGRRRPFIVVGTVVLLLSLSILWYLSNVVHATSDPAEANADTRNLYIAAFFVLNLALNVCYAAYAGLIPDFVGDEQLGEASGVMAVINTLGSLLGVWLVGFLSVEPFSLYAVWILVCCVLTLAVVKESPLVHSPDPISWGEVFRLYFEPLADSNFFWVFVSRFLYYMGVSVQVFIQYFIRDIIHMDSEDAKTQTALVSIIMLASASVVAVPCGVLSDKIGRLPLVNISCALMAITYAGWCFSYELWQILAWSCLFGVANGCFISVEFAIGCDTLPDRDEHAAQALGVWGIAAFLGTTLGPVISGPVLFFLSDSNKPEHYSHLGFTVLLAIGAAFVLSSALALRRLSVGAPDAFDAKL